MHQITAKKHFGQHFLKDEKLAQYIVDALNPNGRYKFVLEVGPGMGVLSQFLFPRTDAYKTQLIEIDKEAIAYLQNKFPDHLMDIKEGDFLNMDLQRFREQVAIIGNFPYNISTQILFKVLENKEMVPEVVGMFQREVGIRIASKPGNRDYGILSVLMQAFYDVVLILTLNEEDFSPPPKVKSVVLRFERKPDITLKCEEKMFFRVVKAAFNQRRKMLRNALKEYIMNSAEKEIPYLDKRAETLSWQQFEELTLLFQNKA